MNITVKTKDRSVELMRKIEQNIPVALEAAGIKSVNLILWQMHKGFGRPIRITGDLQRDVNYRVRAEDKAVDVGNSLKYATHVHNGTRKMKSRPYITNALSGEGHQQQIEEVIADAMKQGIE